MTSHHHQLRAHYQTLYEAWGRQHWWPARTRFEVIIGAYLTQNTAWTNVEKALRKLRAHGALSLKGIRDTPLPKLEQMIRSAGYFRQKARRLKLFVAFLDKQYQGSLSRMFAQPTAALREELLALNGIGPETADSILLYAGQHPVFVVDAYTRRILERHDIASKETSYEEIRRMFEQSLLPLATDPDCISILDAGAALPLLRPEPAAALVEVPQNPTHAQTPAGTCHTPSPMSQARRPPVVQLFNEMHGLIVGVGKNYCLKSQPRCDACPLQKFLPGVQ